MHATRSRDPLSDASFEVRLAAFEALHATTRRGLVSYRAAGDGHARCVVLLHGIGSGAASWVRQLEGLGERFRVLAWDAPGYGDSTPVTAAGDALEDALKAGDYADSLEAWLDALDIGHCVLVGHSLGAIMAGAFAARAPMRVDGLMLLSPAAGYGAATPAVREDRLRSRLQLLDTLGPQGLARERSQNMVSTHASAAALAWVQWNMSRIVPAGYRQATHLLANADLKTDLVRYPCPVRVVVGSADGITPPSACEAIARAAGVALELVPDVGHACYIEAPARLTGLIGEFCESLNGE